MVLTGANIKNVRASAKVFSGSFFDFTQDDICNAAACLPTDGVVLSGVMLSGVMLSGVMLSGVEA